MLKTLAEWKRLRTFDPANEQRLKLNWHFSNTVLAVSRSKKIFFILKSLLKQKQRLPLPPAMWGKRGLEDWLSLTRFGFIL